MSNIKIKRELKADDRLFDEQSNTNVPAEYTIHFWRKMFQTIDMKLELNPGLIIAEIIKKDEILKSVDGERHQTWAPDAAWVASSPAWGVPSAAESPTCFYFLWLLCLLY